MKKFFFILIIIIFPAIILELFLRSDSVYEFVLKKNIHLKYLNLDARNNDVWPETIIFGSSFARQGLNPEVIEKILQNNNIDTNVESLAMYGNEVSVDYFLLKRILKTCKKCPTRIIYGLNDIQFKKYEEGHPGIWRDIVFERLRDLFFVDEEINKVIYDSSNADWNYRDYFKKIDMEHMLRLYFFRTRFSGYFENIFSDSIKEVEKKLNYKFSDINDDRGSGYFSPDEVMNQKTKKKSLDIYKSRMYDYNPGGGGEVFLDRFLELTARNNIKVYLITLPLSNTYTEEFDTQLKKYRYFFNKIKESDKIYKFYHAEIYKNNDSFFFDVNHLNFKGSSEYSKYLGLKLSSIW